MEEKVTNTNQNGIRRVSAQLFFLMQLFNCLMIMFITLVTAHAMHGFILEGNAFDLITKCRVTIVYWKIPVIAGILYVSLLSLLSIECNNHIELIVKLWLEIAVSAGLFYCTGLSYTVMVLLILADVVRNRIDWSKKILYIVLLSCVDLVLNGNVLYRYVKPVAVNQIWTYYRSDVAAVFSGAINIMFLMDVFIFILYMVFLILEQMSEKERIAALYRELSVANERLAEANKQLEEYTGELVKAAETRERNRFAQEIHDTLGHALTGIVTGIEACIMLMDIAPDATKEQLKAIEEVARQGITDVRQSVKALRPDALERLELEDALLKIIDETRRSTGITINYNCTTSLLNFSQDEEDAIYRIVQESVTNAIRHGKADVIDINIGREDGLLNIKVKDNGIGCGKVYKGFGLHHMQERLNLLNGTLTYDGSDGFTILATIPIRWGNAIDEKEDLG